MQPALGWPKKKRENRGSTLWYFLRIVDPDPRSGSGLDSGYLMIKIRKMTEKNDKFQNKKFSQCICMKKFIALREASSLPERTSTVLYLLIFAIFGGNFGFHSLKKYLILFLGSCCEQRVSLQLSGK